MNRLEVVVGGQFGSEAKGHITQRLTERVQQEGDSPQVIRVAGPNAGHTGYDARGTAWALRQVPVAAVTPGPAILGIAAGSEIDPSVLLDEIDRLTDAGLMDNKSMWISDEATIITDEHHRQEGGNGGPLQERLGSTGKGIGAARADRIWRRAHRLRDSEWLQEQLHSRDILLRPAEADLHFTPSHTIIEGTQGYGLGLHAGYYPKCTSSDCRAIDFLAMAGISPWAFHDVAVHVVARIYPIRVAGNSGPLPAGETSWEELGLEPEHTTVTKKVRRVGYPDWQLVNQAVAANGGAPTVRLAITMLDQMFPYLRDKRLFDDTTLTEEVLAYLRMVQCEANAPIEWVTTGPNTATNIRFAEI